MPDFLEHLALFLADVGVDDSYDFAQSEFEIKSHSVYGTIGILEAIIHCSLVAN